MHFLKRERVCATFSMSPLKTYRVFGSLPSAKGLLTTTVIVDTLNEARRGSMPLVSDVPSDVMTAEEVAQRFGVPPEKLKAWCNRTRNPTPHWRFNRCTLRFRLSEMDRWLKEISKPQKGMKQ